MNLPALRNFNNEEECKQYYIQNYCNNMEIKTFDGIQVRFYEEDFEHAFYTRQSKKWKAKKDHYSQERAERIDWIKSVLENPSIVPKKGYDKARRTYDNTRRVAFLAPNNYVVVIYVHTNGTAKFITAYLVDNQDTADKIENSPNWEK